MSKLDLSAVTHGIALFTFDDRNFDGWLAARPLWEKYNAHGTFFVSGPIDDAALAAMEALREAGHTVGLHTLDHADAPAYFAEKGAEAYLADEVLPQLERCRDVRAFAYPNNRRDAETDRALSAYFSRFRAGSTNAAEAETFVPVEALGTHRVMRGFGIGEYYHTELISLAEKLARAARENACVTFFSHNIAPDAPFIHMPTQTLEFCLAECARLGVRAVGFDELP